MLLRAVHKRCLVDDLQVEDVCRQCLSLVRKWCGTRGISLLSTNVRDVHLASLKSCITGKTLAHRLAVAKVQFLLDESKQKEAVALCTDLSQCETVTIKVRLGFSLYRMWKSLR